jgi:hypothetical protein
MRGVAASEHPAKGGKPVVLLNGKIYWTVREIADRAGVPIHQVYTWIKGLGVGQPLVVVQFNGRQHIDDEEWRAFSRSLPARAPGSAARLAANNRHGFARRLGLANRRG